MVPVAKLSYATLAYFCAALALGLGYAYTIQYPAFLGSCLFAWMGGVQIINAAAPSFPRPVGRCIHWVHAMTFEAFAFLGVVLLRCFPSRQKFIPGRGGKPILLVHGYVNHGSAWNFLMRHLKAVGLGPLYTINLGYPFRSIRLYAEQVKQRADQILDETKAPSLILIGHSMGGLISAWYATKLDSSHRVSHLITIASPFQGTPMARVGLGSNAREMEPNSPLLEELKAAMILNPRIRFHHIATKSDQLVIPGDSAILPEHPHFVMEDIGHASLLYSKRVAHQISKWLS